LVNRALPINSTLKRLARRTPVTFSPSTCMRPDLALVKANDKQAYLFAEVLVPGDHSADTVIKKCLCQQFLLPRLWIVDPRYLNLRDRPGWLPVRAYSGKS
jgi:Uma2 family endonuclease